MAIAQTAEPTLEKPLRLWPGVVFVIVQWLLWIVVPVIPVFPPEAVLIGAIGGLASALPIVVWWVFFSRARWSERLGAIVVMIIAVIATRPLLDKSIQTGMMGLMFSIYVIPTLCLALVAGAVAGRRVSAGSRRAAMVAAILLACGVWTMLRTDGIRVGRAELAWRWTTTPEERLLAQGGDEPAAFPAAPAAVETTAEWPGFRGPDRNSIVPGVRIETDWAASPPVEIWRRPIGPGWSSFAVRGGLLYTQEQRGDDEVVACYKVSTGEPVWRHRDAVRFWDAGSGAGPRATPTLGNGRVYTFGATGILNALEARDGAVVWSRNVVSDTGAKVPGWGFASSPLVVGEVVFVAPASHLDAYALARGNPRAPGVKGEG